MVVGLDLDDKAISLYGTNGVLVTLALKRLGMIVAVFGLGKRTRADLYMSSQGTKGVPITLALG